MNVSCVYVCTDMYVIGEIDTRASENNKRRWHLAKLLLQGMYSVCMYVCMCDCFYLLMSYRAFSCVSVCICEL